MIEADYVIVGGGTAGCVLASRLSENPSNSVVVLEAGPLFRGLQIQIPAAFGALYEQGRYHWHYVSEPERFAGDKKLLYKMGRLFGGSSAINGMVWVRGNPRDFDDWAEGGCPDWDYKTLEPVFRRIEAFEDTSDPAMGHEGPIPIRVGKPEAQPLAKAFLEAARQAGETINTNYNDCMQDGFCALHQNIRDGRRGDVYQGYIAPAEKRRNLRLVPDSRACRVDFSGDRATGVVAEHRGNLVSWHALREVILCAGAVASPQLLEVSGVGDSTILKNVGIRCWHDLPGVGENFHTHPTVSLTFRCKKPVSISSAVKGGGRLVAGLQWLLNRTGPAATNHFEAGAFLRAFPDSDRPDYQLTFIPLALSDTTRPIKGHGFQVYIELINCRSRGSTHVTSIDNRDNPKFSFNFLKEQRDVDVYLSAVRKVREVVSQAAFAPYLAGEISPGESVQSDHELETWIRASTGISHHFAGSCKLGSDRDPLAVVGNDLRVHGLRNVRVVDASVMPTVVSGNTHAATIVIAENAARMIGTDMDTDS